MIAALLIAPVLALVAYFSVDAMVSDKPAQAQPGHSYALVAMPQCRYTSGKCTFKNAEFKVVLTPQQVSADGISLTLHSVFPLQAAKMALVEQASDAGSPLPMEPVDTNGQDWKIDLHGSHGKSSQLRLVVVAGDAFYFGETGLDFVTYATSFDAGTQ